MTKDRAFGRGEVLVGTSGWSYPHWAGRFYPKGLPQRRWLEYAISRFDSLEINGTFYRLPADTTVSAWAGAAPPGFTYAIKASRWITHARRLRDPQTPLRNLLERVRPLGPSLGPLLFQLPPQAHRDDDSLAGFLAAVAAEPNPPRVALEFRHDSWFQPAVYELLQRREAAFVISDLAGRLWPLVTTAPLVYVRLHGPRRAYADSYSESELKVWAARIGDWIRDGHEVRVYFDNDELGYAAQDAMQLTAILTDAGLHERQA